MNIIELAKRAHRELVTIDYPGHIAPLDPWTQRLCERFAHLVRQQVLEEAAVVCENPDLIMNSTFDGVAAAIRALKGEQE
jgi:3,4-dihydroxy-2-butanone 4-phosphate synthase